MRAGDIVVLNRVHRSVLRPGFVAISAIPILIFFAMEFLVGIVFVSADTRGVVYSDSPTCAAELSYRLQMIAMMAIYFIASVLVIAYFIRDIYNNFSSGTVLLVLLSYSLCIASAAVIIVAAYSGVVVPTTRELLGSAIFDEAFKRLATCSANSRWSQASFDKIIYFTNVLAILGVPAFVSGGVSCTARILRIKDSANWQWQAQRLKAYIFLSAALLVIGVLYMRAWVIYPAFALEELHRKIYISNVNAYISYSGLEFVLLIAGYAFPVYYVLHRRSQSISSRILMDEKGMTQRPDEREYLRELTVIAVREKININASEFGAMLAALSSPLIAGSLPSLVGLF